MESQAASIQACELALLPSLVHTTDYLSAVHANDPKLSHLVALHNLNQQRLVARTVRLHAIVEESVLYRPVGGPEVLIAQLRRLREFAVLPNVTIQVLPMASGMTAGLLGSFRLLHFPADTIDDVGFVDNAIGGVQVIKKQYLAKLAAQFRHIAMISLTPRDSLNVIAHRASNLPRSMGGAPPAA
jgi:hypothetical protein